MKSETKVCLLLIVFIQLVKEGNLTNDKESNVSRYFVGLNSNFHNIFILKRLKPIPLLRKQRQYLFHKHIKNYQQVFLHHKKALRSQMVKT